MNIALIPKAGGGFTLNAYLYSPLGRTYSLQIWREETEGSAFVLSNHPFTIISAGKPTRFSRGMKAPRLQPERSRSALL
jgi:hypothetical protein